MFCEKKCALTSLTRVRNKEKVFENSTNIPVPVLEYGPSRHRHQSNLIAHSNSRTPCCCCSYPIYSLLLLSLMSTSSLTSTTAPGKVFASRLELAEHYKSEWHRYNLKRREAGLPLLREQDFQARLQAALALRQERELSQQRSGTSHLKTNKARKSKNAKPKSESLQSHRSNPAARE